MRVLFLTWWYPTAEQPGTGVFVREHALAAQRAGAEVAVIHVPDLPFRGRGLWRMERELDYELAQGIATFRVTSRRIPVPFSRRLSYRATSWLHRSAVALAILRLRRAGFDADLIHAHVFQAGAVATGVRRVIRRPVVISEHSTGFVRRSLAPGMEKRARRAFARAERVMPVTEFLRRAIEAYGMRGRFEVVSNAVDAADFHPAEPDARSAGGHAAGPKRLLFVGGLEPTEHKGFPTLLRALERLARSDWRLDVVGDGPSRAEYEERVAAAGLADRITFLGYRPKPEIADLMRAADVFLLPSRFETQGVVLLEAMMCGLPIVSTTAGAIPEVVPPEAGILVEPDDDAALAAAIEKVLGGEAKYEPAAIAAHARERYSAEAVGRKLAAVYESVVAEARGGSGAGKPAG
jgi:glycosyltransferase involved in cell wall biosynthesis